MAAEWGSVPCMRRTPSRTQLVVDLVVATLGLSLACTADFVLGSDGRFRHAKHGYSIADPALQTAGWKALDLPTAELAYSDGYGGSMTMLRECRGSAQPQLLARQLRIGLERLDEPVIESHPVGLGGDPGWSQTFLVVEGAEEVLVRSVTLSAGLCTYDWVLVGAEDSARQNAFDLWWSSFERTGSPGNPPSRGVAE